MKPSVRHKDHAEEQLLDVFAFGSNLDPTDFNAWCKREAGLTPVMSPQFRGWLRGYRLCWDYFSPVRQGGAANIVVDNQAAVAGVVFRVNPATLRALDQKEGHPERYRRIRVEVQSMTEPTSRSWVWTYSVTERYRLDEPVPPTRAYLDVMLRGIETQELPDSWRDAVLASVEALER